MPIKGKLILADGSVFEGTLLSECATHGEVVFNTGMTGYQEILTDPSYGGQIITLTYPLIGNYGTFEPIVQGRQPYCAGFIVSELCSFPSNWQKDGSILSYLENNHIPCLYDVDTRAVTRAIRKHGVMKGIIVPATYTKSQCQGLLEQETATDMVKQVTTKEIQHMGEGDFHVAVIDYGAKLNILRSLVSEGFKLTIFPATVSAEEVIACKPDGVFLSNGPGDPKDLSYTVEEVKKLFAKVPIFGICMGHQVIALALGGDTYKMSFGHRGSNHPVQDLQTKRVYITSQNHGYAVSEESLQHADVRVTHRSVNDGSVEGLRHNSLPIMSVQYHPEASPGPTDNLYLFTEFKTMMMGDKK